MQAQQPVLRAQRRHGRHPCRAASGERTRTMWAISAQSYEYLSPSPAAYRNCIESPAMRAATIRDGDLLVEEHPDPEPGKGEVLVRVRAAGINGGDLHQLAAVNPA